MPKGSKRLSRFHGVVVVDKPTGMTSQDVVNVIRRVSGTRRVGHTGTLDPLATGLLLVLVGEATKLSEYMVGFDKVYEGTMRLGMQSDTHDSAGEIVAGPGGGIPPIERLRELAKPLTGDLQQVPPAFSAVKVRGKKLYEYARAGEVVEAEPRDVHVSEFSIMDVDGDTATFRIACSSGTYVRTLVNDIGQAAGCGALVASLRRTAIADFTLDEAATLEKLQEGGLESFGEFVLPMLDTVTRWPIYYVGEDGQMWLKRGQAIPSALGTIDKDSQPARMNENIFLCPPGQDALAVAKVIPAPPSRPPAQLARHVGMWFQPVKLLVGE